MTNRKDGKLASFALGFGVVFVYYILLYTSRAFALGGRLQPTLAPWLVNIVLVVAGLALVFWRAGAADQPIRINIPAFWRRTERSAARAGSGRRAFDPRRARRPRRPDPPHRLAAAATARLLHRAPLPVGLRSGVRRRCSGFSTSRRSSIWPTSSSAAPRRRGCCCSYFYFQTPQYVYYIIPLSALVASLVTIGMLTKNSELIIMRACGISLYRSAIPLVLFAALASLALFELQEHVLADANREAARLNGIIRGYPMQTFGILNRRWIVGTGGDIYHYEYLRSGQEPLRPAVALRARSRRVEAAGADLRRERSCWRGPSRWEARQGWRREFGTTVKRNVARTVVNYTPFASRPLGARAAVVLQDRRARSRPHDLRPAQELRRASFRPAATTRSPTWSSCSGRSPSPSSP